MSALTDAVEVRYNAQDLIQMTNAGDDLSATEVNQPRFDAAAADAVAVFLTDGAIAFDETDDQHIQVAVQGVVAFLKGFGKSADAAASDQQDAYIDRVVLLAKFSTRARISPKTTSKDKDVTIPSLDARRFTDYVPDPPPNRTLQDD